LSTRQKGGLYKVNQYYDEWGWALDSNKCIVKDTDTAIFAYEGLGIGLGDSKLYAGYNAMMVVARNRGVAYLTLQGDTMPYKTTGNNSNGMPIATVAEGIYSLIPKTHKGYASAELSNFDTGNDGLPAFRGGVLYTEASEDDLYPLAGAIRLHTGGDVKGVNYSEGCQMVYWTDYIEFGIAAGFLTSNAREKSGSKSVNDLRGSLDGSYNNNTFSGVYIIDRTFM
jgi:hypothetical protein